MSTPTPEIGALKVNLSFSLNHMDLHFSVAGGKVQIEPRDFVQLMSTATPKHAGVFQDTVDRLLALTAEQGETPVLTSGAAPDVRRQLVDAMARVKQVHNCLQHALDDVWGELARLTARPFSDDEEYGRVPPVAAPPAATDSTATETTAAPAAAPAPADAAATESTAAAPTPTAALEPAAPTPATNT